MTVYDGNWHCWIHLLQCHIWLTNFQFSSKCVCTDAFIANKEIKENLGYIFVSYFLIDKKMCTYHTSLEKSPLASFRTAFDIHNSSDHLSGIEVLITTIHQLTHWDLQAITFWSPVIWLIFLGHPKI